LNAHHDPVSFTIPEWDAPTPWQVELDTAEQHDNGWTAGPATVLEVAGRAVVLLVRRR